MRNLVRFLCVFGLMTSATLSRADEGMWLLNAPPAALKERYGFTPDAAWLEHVQRASVRFNNGGSGSFVSPDGLIITNHHVASDVLYKLSSSAKNLLRDGFRARSRAEELKATDLELNMLVSIEDVTERLNAAVKPEMNPAEAFAARRSAMAAIEKESLDATGLRSDVVTLYQGARYHLYRYKRYMDVRLVFAPEQQAAFFGGDPDNFEFPRFNLDVTFFRAYENGQPAKVDHWFKWSRNGAAENELVFVTGHPGSTSRLLTVAELEYQRDVRIPNALKYLKNNEVLLSAYSTRSVENARVAKDDLFSIQNSRKVYDGRTAALLDPEIWKAKHAEEAALRQFAKDKPEFADIPAAYAQIAEAQQLIGAQAMRYNLVEAYNFNSTLFGLARQLYRSAIERAKPSGERLREYRDSNLPSLELALFSEEPIYDEYEQLKIASFLGFAAQTLGVNDPSVQLALGGKAPGLRAAELVTGSKVKDVAFRKELYAMTPAQIAAVDDPLIALVRALDPEARAVRKLIEEQTEVKEQAHAKLAKVRFAKDGTSVFPDATFTLRLSYGTIRAYEEAGKRVAPFTTLGGMFERSEAQGAREPFDLPKSWVEAKSKLALETPYNFVSTADIIGGNSGSPTLNRAAEFVGIIFDGNIYSLVGDFAYSDVQARAISVDSRGIIEALRNVYGADELVAEIFAAREP